MTITQNRATWHQQFTDQFGTPQDYVSTKKGLDEGVAMGLLEIESHGWTHMQADLTSAPGPWWGAPAPPRPKRGWAKMYVDHVLQAHEGADLDFLVGCSGAEVPRESH